MGVDFTFVLSVFHALDRVRLECISFFEQFAYALGSRAFDVGQSLQVSGLAP